MSSPIDRGGAPASEATAPARGLAPALRACLPLAVLLAVVVPGLYLYTSGSFKLGWAAAPKTAALPSLRDDRPLVENDTARTSTPPPTEAVATSPPAPAPIAESPAITEPVAAPAIAPPTASPKPEPEAAPTAAPVVITASTPASEPAPQREAPVAPNVASPPDRIATLVEPPSTTPAATEPTVAPVTASEGPRASPKTGAQSAILLQRGAALLEQGNIAAARLFLERAVAADNAEAALLLGATFDPAWLTKRGVLGVKPEVALARKWYTEAARLGATQADARLSNLEALR
ncbi:MAG: hypothetical protein ACKVP7_23875 [Hyphomicrobiaceae bacterium]